MRGEVATHPLRLFGFIQLIIKWKWRLIEEKKKSRHPSQILFAVIICSVWERGISFEFTMVMGCLLGLVNIFVSRFMCRLEWCSKYEYWTHESEEGRFHGLSKFISSSLAGMGKNVKISSMKPAPENEVGVLTTSRRLHWT